MEMFINFYTLTIASLLGGVVSSILVMFFADHPFTTFKRWLFLKKCPECHNTAMDTVYDIQHRNWCKTGARVEDIKAEQRREINEFRSI